MSVYKSQNVLAYWYYVSINRCFNSAMDVQSENVKTACNGVILGEEKGLEMIMRL